MEITRVQKFVGIAATWQNLTITDESVSFLFSQKYIWMLEIRASLLFLLTFYERHIGLDFLVDFKGF